jgi:hypothetical protein
MSEWITDRLPTAKDAKHNQSKTVLVTCGGEVYETPYNEVENGEPWMSMPAPYVKPKRWTVKWDERRDLWAIFDGNLRSHLFGLPVEAVEAAQQIEDIYNKVIP